MDSFKHIPVLLREVLVALEPVPGGRYIDGTLGGGGHAEAILKKALPNGWLGGCDRDEVAVKVATSRLTRLGGQVDCWVGRCSGLRNRIRANSVDGVLLDLGVSSPQLEEQERGFSFQKDGPLDMRMGADQQLTAAIVVNEWSEDELSSIFREFGEKRQGRRIAREVVKARPLESTLQLAELITRVKSRRGRLHPATKVFQAIRMAVNDELEELNRALPVVASLLKQGGRMAVISFHSAEARAMKKFGNQEVRDYEVVGEVDRPEFRVPRERRMRWVERRAICPTEKELAANPRSRSAQLRVLEKC